MITGASKESDYLSQLLDFTKKQAVSCLFPLCIFFILAFTQAVPLPLIPRYDFILLFCLGVQVIMIITRFETFDELKVICVFHLVGLLLELYKTAHGSWSYPGFAYTKLGAVPLYSGFLYASVASYMCQAWRRLDLKLYQWPNQFLVYPFGVLIYLNFFTEHFLPDIRWILIPMVFLIFRKTYVEYTVKEVIRRMPMPVSFFLIGLFVWLAENIVTFFNAWKYPHQEQAWSMVHSGKISSWFLLVIVSFICVAELKHVKERFFKKAEAIEDKQNEKNFDGDFGDSSGDPDTKETI